MKTDIPQTIYLKDYKPLPYTVGSVHMDFDVHEDSTLVKTRLILSAKDAWPEDIFLNGEDLELVSVTIDDKALTAGTDFTVSETGLALPCPAQKSFTLEIVTRLYPEKNTRLEGLYKSGDTYCTQCEAEGFRRITYYPDRPDMMSVFTVRIEADKEAYPVLLSNGNLTESGACRDDDARHFAVWHDPFPKPCYLFALVCGDLVRIEDTFTTKSGQSVRLHIYVRAGDEDQCTHAMESLKKSMAWDEDAYGLEYDLDIFNIVAVSDFNMGAMENKSLNIFNTALVLAHRDTATDQDFARVESVIAHEYFHNWSGNRITCRDWFQLSLKEGLTVFRDQEFSADMNHEAVQRIDDVLLLRQHQFPEDAGPLAHPIRPDHYIEINNFYTRTVYEKGAEVIRMMRTILGPDAYRKGTDLYFSRHDGEAATCEDFIRCMEEAGDTDLSQFRLWYTQAGTPTVTFEGRYAEEKERYEVTLTQTIPDTPGQTDKKPMHIPVALGFLDAGGRDMTAETVLHLKENTQTFTFDGIKEKPVPSILRHFSAPVILKTDLDDDALGFLMRHDGDGFNRWEAAQNLAVRTVSRMVDDHTDAPDSYIETYGALLHQALEGTHHPALMARGLTLPGVSLIGQDHTPCNPVAIYEARCTLLKQIKRAHKHTLEKLYKKNRSDAVFDITPEAMGKRALQNTTLNILTVHGGTGCRRRAKEQYDSANNMTDRMAALSALARMACTEREEALADFYDRFKAYPLVIDKWFAVQASAAQENSRAVIKTLAEHPDFNIKNPNRVRALYAAFAMNNPSGFHAQDGSGYEILVDAIIRLNTINPQIAARLLTPMRDWRRYTPDRQEKMQAGLERIMRLPDLSPHVFEIASKSLA